MTTTPANGQDPIGAQGPTEEELTDALWADRLIREQGQLFFDVGRPFFRELLSLLADRLNQPATEANILELRQTYHLHCVKQGFIPALREQMPASFYGSERKKDEALAQAASDLTEALENFPGLIAHALPGAAGLLSRQVGLSAAAKKLYRSDPDKFTLGDVLRLCPAVFVTSRRI